MEYKKIGIIIADDLEFKPMKKYSQAFNSEETTISGFEAVRFFIDGREIIALKSGVGKVNAATATTALVLTENPDCVLNVGLSGGVKGVNRGTVFAGTQFVECDFDMCILGYAPGQKPDQEVYVYNADEELLSKIPEDLGIFRFKCGCGDIFLTRDDIKADFYEKFGINTFDMETGAIAGVCYWYKKPFMSIRKVSDDSEDTAAEDYRSMNTLEETHLSEVIIKIIRNF